MRSYKENHQESDENAIFNISALSVIGDRDQQQDSFGYEIKYDEGMAVICDGMGGHECGRLASSKSVDRILDTYLNTYPCENLTEFLKDIVQKIDTEVSSFKHMDGSRMKTGSTLVAVVVGKERLNWVSVGDSRLYIYRQGELIRATKDHNYKLILDEKLLSGQIDDDEYNSEIDNGEALISFIGAGRLPKIDYNETPFALKKNDRLLIVSDGLYKLLSDEQIKTILDNFANINDALNALEWKQRKAAKSSGIKRDNTTAIIIQIK
ncbi:MAG: PP2C family protein-serine/threonine phosphatase [Lachnospiraceae bacterium]